METRRRDKELKEILIWIAGMISTDGNIQKTKCNGVGFRIYSAEKDWMEFIQNRLLEVEIKSSISKYWEEKQKKYYYYLYIKNPRQLVLMFRRENIDKWMMQRKWKQLENKYLNNINFKYSEAEEGFIFMNYMPKSEYGEEECSKSIKDISKFLGRSQNAIKRKAYRLFFGLSPE